MGLFPPANHDNKHDFEHLIEIGPSPTLTGMATHTLKAKYETLDGSVTQNRSILCHAKNVKEIYYQYEDEVEAPASSSEAVDAPTIVESTAPIAATTTVSAPSAVLDLDDITRLSVRNRMTTNYINLDDITRLGYGMSTVIMRIVYINNIPQCQE